LKIDVNHYIKKPCTSPKVLQWKKQELDGQKLSATLTHGRPAEDIKRNKIIEKNNKNAVHIDSDLLPTLSQSSRLWQKPSQPVKQNFSIENAKGIIKYNETVSKAYEKRSMHNTRSRSPREGRRVFSSTASDDNFYTVAEIKTQLGNVSLNKTTKKPENSQKDPPNLMVGQSSELNETPSTQPLYNDTKTDESSSEQIFAVQQPIILVEETEKPWCQVNFYECNKKVDFYSSTKSHVDIFFPADSNHSTMNRYKKGGHASSGSQKADSKIDLIDLSSISNVNRSPETWDLLEKLSKGISLQYDRNRRIVSCQNNCKSLKVYVLSYLMNVECGKHGESLIQIMPGGQRAVYDGWQLAKTIDGINSQTQNDLEKWVLVGQYANYFTVFRISFQPWGPEYPKKHLTDCDVWLEIQMCEYVDWINQIENHYEYVLHDSRFDQPETTPKDDDYPILEILS